MGSGEGLDLRLCEAVGGQANAIEPPLVADPEQAARVEQRDVGVASQPAAAGPPAQGREGLEAAVDAMQSGEGADPQIAPRVLEQRLDVGVGEAAGPEGVVAVAQEPGPRGAGLVRQQFEQPAGRAQPQRAAAVLEQAQHAIVAESAGVGRVGAERLEAGLR